MQRAARVGLLVLVMVAGAAAATMLPAVESLLAALVEEPVEQAPDEAPAHCPVPALAGALVADHRGVPAGDGRFRLCLGTPVRALIEGSAECSWTAGRTRVTSVVADVRAVLPRGSELLLALNGSPRRSLTIETAGQLDAQAGDDRVRLTASADATTGWADFARVQLDLSPSEPDGPRASGRRGTTLAGTISWRCAEPPPMEPGYSRGTVHATLGVPVSERWMIGAACFWAAEPNGPRVVSVTTWEEPVAFGGQLVTFDPTAVEVVARSQDFESSTSYQQGPATIVHRIESLDGSSGRVDFEGLGQRVGDDAGQRLGGPGGPMLLAGSMDWSCEGPPDVVPVAAGG
jgi:hypothetical protein